MPGIWYYGREYEERGAEQIVSRYLRKPAEWIVIVGSAKACLVPRDKVAYRHFSGPNFESLIEIWGPPDLIADLRNRQCQVLPSSTGETTISTEASSPSSSGQTESGTPSPDRSSNT